MNQIGKWNWLGVVAALALVGAGCVDRGAQKQAKRTEAIVTDPVRAVSVALPQSQSLKETLEITGQIQTALDVQVSAKISGRLTEVFVQEGDEVTAGQVLAKQETTQVLAQVRQAQASLQSAQATYLSAQSQLASALRNAAINPIKSRSNIRQSEAQLRSSKAQLQKTLNGARPEERRQAEATLASAKQGLDTQRKELDRVRVLVQQGAVPASRLDQQLASYQAAEAQFRNAQESVNLLRIGARQEDLETAREAVRQAEEALLLAKTNKQLDTLYTDQVEVARAQVASARSQIENAKASVEIATQALDDAVIRAPFSGRISGRAAQVGTVLGPGTPVVRVVGKSSSYFEGEIPETQVSKVKAGQSVQVDVDSVNVKLSATVSGISPRGSSVGRQFLVRVVFNGAPAGLAPGLFAKGTITLSELIANTVVPQTAVVDRGGRNVVFVVQGDVVREVKVETGLRGDRVVEVKGIDRDANVVVSGQQGLEDGTKVRIERTAAKDAGGATVGS